MLKRNDMVRFVRASDDTSVGVSPGDILTVMRAAAIGPHTLLTCVKGRHKIKVNRLRDESRLIKVWLEEVEVVTDDE